MRISLQVIIEPSKNQVASNFKLGEQLYLSFLCLFHLAKVLKFRSEVLHRKKVNSQVSTVVKNANFSTSNNPNLLKIKLQVVSDPLNNFT